MVPHSCRLRHAGHDITRDFCCSAGPPRLPFPTQPAPLKVHKTQQLTQNLQPGHSTKRHKGGARSISGSATSSAHPLRQTSFPPEESAIGDNTLRSPSVESDFTGTQSAAAGNTITGTKKRGRGKGGKKAQRDSTQSVKSGGGGHRGGNTTNRGGRATSHNAAAAEYDEIDDEDDDDDDGGGFSGPRLDDPDQKADREKLGVLVDALDREQFERYEMFRRIKFRKETVRKITNYVVSQSVPPSVVLTINGFAKTFVGVLIERARRVQSEAAAATTRPKAVKEEKGSAAIEVDPTDFRQSEGGFGPRLNGSAPVDPARLVVGDDGISATAVVDGKAEEDEEGLEHLGPLMPEHLREALRRYKRDGEGGGTGLAGVSVGLGIQGTGSARLQGRRLFK